MCEWKKRRVNIIYTNMEKLAVKAFSLWERMRDEKKKNSFIFLVVCGRDLFFSFFFR